MIKEYPQPTLHARSTLSVSLRRHGLARRGHQAPAPLYAHTHESRQSVISQNVYSIYLTIYEQLLYVRPSSKTNG